MYVQNPLIMYVGIRGDMGRPPPTRHPYTSPGQSPRHARRGSFGGILGPDGPGGIPTGVLYVQSPTIIHVQKDSPNLPMS